MRERERRERKRETSGQPQVLIAVNDGERCGW